MANKSNPPVFSNFEGTIEKGKAVMHEYEHVSRSLPGVYDMGQPAKTLEMIADFSKDTADKAVGIVNEKVKKDYEYSDFEIEEIYSKAAEDMKNVDKDPYRSPEDIQENMKSIREKYSEKILGVLSSYKTGVRTLPGYDKYSRNLDATVEAKRRSIDELEKRAQRDEVARMSRYVTQSRLNTRANLADVPVLSNEAKSALAADIDATALQIRSVYSDASTSDGNPVFNSEEVEKYTAKAILDNEMLAISNVRNPGAILDAFSEKTKDGDPRLVYKGLLSPRDYDVIYNKLKNGVGTRKFAEYDLRMTDGTFRSQITGKIIDRNSILNDKEMNDQQKEQLLRRFDSITTSLGGRSSSGIYISKADVLGKSPIELRQEQQYSRFKDVNPAEYSDAIDNMITQRDNPKTSGDYWDGAYKQKTGDYSQNTLNRIAFTVENGGVPSVTEREAADLDTIFAGTSRTVDGKIDTKLIADIASNVGNGVPPPHIVNILSYALTGFSYETVNSGRNLLFSREMLGQYFKNQIDTHNTKTVSDGLYLIGDMASGVKVSENVINSIINTDSSTFPVEGGFKTNSDKKQYEANVNNFKTSSIYNNMRSSGFKDVERIAQVVARYGDGYIENVYPNFNQINTANTKITHVDASQTSSYIKIMNDVRDPKIAKAKVTQDMSKISTELFTKIANDPTLQEYNKELGITTKALIYNTMFLSQGSKRGEYIVMYKTLNGVTKRYTPNGKSVRINVIVDRNGVEQTHLININGIRKIDAENYDYSLDYNITHSEELQRAKSIKTRQYTPRKGGGVKSEIPKKLTSLAVEDN